MKKSILVLLTLSILLTGCTGPFALTKTLHKWQTDVSENQWIEEVTFLGCAIFLYGPTLLVDSLFLNSVEFWTGDNPMDSVNNQNGNEMCLRSVAAQL